MTRVLAEYEHPDTLLHAVHSLRDQGYHRLEVYSPYPLLGVDEALGRKGSRLPWLVFVGGAGAAAGAYFLEWLLNAFLYPLNVGNRPPHYPLSYVPITFEMGVLFASFTAFALVFALAKLPTLAHPVFDAEGFTSASNDKFWLEVSSRDVHYHPDQTVRELEATNALRVVTTEDWS
jgi:hypothetical protein